MRTLDLRETQLALLEILKKVHNICEEIGAKYYLMYGTLIGAIRHQGFIPWDDDIDIVMLRDDYELLLAYFEENKEALYPLQVMNYKVYPKCPYMITRISDDRYQLIRNFGESEDIGTFIDIYPYDYMDSNEKKVDDMCKKSKRYSKALGRCLQTDVIRFNISVHGFLKSILFNFIYIIPKIVGWEFCQRKLIELCKENIEKEGDKYYLGCVIWDLGHQDIVPADWMKERVMVPFEGCNFWAPKEYHKILEQGYGDYMTWPPKRLRVAHHYYTIVEK